VAGSLDHAYVAPGATLIGDVRLGVDSGVFHGTVIRAEAAPVTIEAEANVQDNCVIEATAGHPVTIGARTSVGHNARVYGATIEPAALIAIGATIHAGARIGTHAIVAANAVVPEGMQVPAGKLLIGNGRILRDVTEAEIRRIESGGVEYARLSREYRRGATKQSSPASQSVPRA
jgi:carbonic anhydrase/acetyltransferase-like protein (isoleucine patch superfamily)